jgi:hypothetical protein
MGKNTIGCDDYEDYGQVSVTLSDRTYMDLTVS